MPLSPEDFESLIRAAPGPRMVFDRDDVIVAVNDAFLRATNKTREAVLGKGLFEAFPENPDAPDGPKRLRASLDRVLATGQPDRMPIARHDPGRPGGEGGGFVERHWASLNYPIVDDEGRVTHIVHEVEDVTERIGAERDRRATDILESITDAFFALDRDWRFTYVNRQADRVLRRAPGDLLGKVLWDEYPGLAGSEFERAYHRAMDRREPSSVTAFYPDHDRWYEVHTDPSPEGISIYFRDVSVRMRAQEEVRRLGEAYRLALDSADLGSWHLDPATKELHSDERMRAIFGATGDRLSYEEALGRIHPDDRGRVAAKVEEAIRPDAPGVYSDEHRVVHPDGSIRWVSVKGRANFIGRGEGRTLSSFDGTIADVTDRKQIEEYLRESEDRYRALFRSIDEGLCVVEMVFDDRGDPVDYRFLETNPAFEGQTGLGNVVGRTMRELVPDHEPRWFEAYGRVAKTGEPERFVSEAKALGRWFDVFAFRLGGPDGRRVAALFNDITRRRRVEEATRESEAKLRFLATLDAETRALAEPEEVTAVTARLLGEYLGADRCAYASVEDESVFVITGDYPRGVSSIVGRWPMAAFGEDFTRRMLAGEPYVVSDSEADPRIGPDDLPAYRATDIRAVICVPLHKGGRFSAAMAVHQKTPRRWTPEEVDLVRFVVSRCWESLERARVERSLRESEERFRLFMEHNPAFAWITDADGRIEYVSPAYYRMFRLPKDDIVGESAFDLYPPEIAAQHVANTRAVAEGGRAIEATEDGVLRDGRIGKFLVYKFPLPGGDGRRLVGGVAVDITARVEAERALALSEERYRTLAQNVPHLFWTCLPDGRCDYLSRQWVEYTGLSEGEQLGLEWLSLVIHPDDRDRAFRLWMEAVQDRATYDLNYRIKGADGSYRWFKTRGTPIRDASGIIVRWFGTCTDIDAQIRAEESLRESDRKKDEFLAMLAHELRNPLSAIGNAVQVVRRSHAPEHLEWAKEVIDKHVRSLARMIDDLLDVSRITRGKIELRKRAIDVLPILSQAVETVRPIIDERKHDLTLSHSSASMWVEADPHRLEQVLVNLLTNAAKYTDSGGTITLSAKPDGGSVAISVVDNGAGIPPGRIPEMFELFAQGDRSIARSEGGLGIGLTLVKNLVEMHGGSVAARSEGPGKGSEFTVRLPAVRAPEVERQARPPRPDARPRGGARVLVVDDNEDSARGMVRLLRILGHDVETALDGPSAIEAAREHRPEFILLDIGLPGMDGYQVAETLRAEGFTGATIIAVSGYGEEAARRRSREAGFNHHLVKPVDYDALMALIRGDR